MKKTKMLKNVRKRKKKKRKNGAKRTKMCEKYEHKNWKLHFFTNSGSEFFAKGDFKAFCCFSCKLYSRQVFF